MLEVLTPAHMRDVFYICQRLRPLDRKEIFATQVTDDPRELVETTLAMPGFSWIVYWDGVPCAVIGGYPAHGSCWTAFAYGTDQYSRVIRLLTRWAREFMMPAVINAGATKVFVYVLAEYVQARKWLRMMGYTEIVFIPDFGKNDEDFVLMYWKPERA